MASMTLVADAAGVIVACEACGQKNRLPFARLGEATRCGKCRGALGPPSAPIDLRTTEHFDRLVQESPLPVLVDFWAAWCGPCRFVAPEVEKVAAAAAGRLVVAKLDTDRLADVSERFAVRSIPTLMVFSAGREVTRIVGAQPAESIQRAVWSALS
jgi:thioredoxin 2